MGGSLERFEACVQDISAMVALASRYSSTIILKGHSLGCQKILEYADRTNTDLPLILMSPCSTRAIQEAYIDGEPLSSQAQRLREASISSGLPEWAHLANTTEFGFTANGVKFPVPISADALKNALASNMFIHLDYSRARITGSKYTRGLVIAGSEDTFRRESYEELNDYFAQLFKTMELKWIYNAGHAFKGFELDVAQLVAAWLREIGGY